MLMTSRPAHDERGGERDITLRRHLPLVRCIARALAAFKPPRVEFDDMLSWGVEGLLDAYERYRPERQVSFKTYAAFRIRGMILDRLREEDHLPRRVRDISTRCEKTHTRLANLLQREPREDELAAALGMDLPTWHAFRGARHQGQLVSIEELATAPEGATGPSSNRLSGYESDPCVAAITRERMTLVSKAVARLTTQEQTIMGLYYGLDRTMKDVGQAIGLSEARVSQLHAQGLARLRMLLAPHGEETR